MRASCRLTALLMTALAAAPALAQAPSPLLGQTITPTAPAAGAAGTAAAPVTRTVRQPAASPTISLTVVNARGVAATQIVAEVSGQVVTLPKPLAPNARVVWQLPRGAGCLVSLSVTYQDGEVAEVEDYDACADKTLRLTD